MGTTTKLFTARVATLWPLETKPAHKLPVWEGLQQMQLFYKRMGEVLHPIPRCGGGTASMGMGTLAPSIQNGKGNQREENGQKTLKRRARGCANRGSKRMYFVRCGPS